MHDLAQKRCRNHAQREAAGRCPECERFFCRECLTEHEGRVLCATCLAAGAADTARSKIPLAGLGRVFQLAVAVTVLWIFFSSFGRAVVLLPDTFHEDVYKQNEWRTELDE